jgi:hypothetical protein
VSRENTSVIESWVLKCCVVIDLWKMCKFCEGNLCVKLKQHGDERNICLLLGSLAVTDGTLVPSHVMLWYRQFIDMSTNLDCTFLCLVPLIDSEIFKFPNLSRLPHYSWWRLRYVYIWIHVSPLVLAHHATCINPWGVCLVFTFIGYTCGDTNL